MLEGDEGAVRIARSPLLEAVCERVGLAGDVLERAGGKLGELCLGLFACGRQALGSRRG